MERTPTVPEELLSIVKALAIASRNSFMSRDHAAAIWKKILSVSGFDITKLPIKKVTNGPIKEN